MKKKINTVVFCAIYGLIASSNAIADPNIIEVGIVCPDTSGTGQHTLSNFNSYIAGYGKEYINSGNPAHVSPYFSMKTFGGNFPALISGGAYASTSTQFDPIQSLVTCNYTSSAGFDPIHVSYWLTNAQGSTILSQTPDTITINLYLGLKQ